MLHPPPQGSPKHQSLNHGPPEASLAVATASAVGSGRRILRRRHPGSGFQVWGLGFRVQGFRRSGFPGVLASAGDTFSCSLASTSLAVCFKGAPGSMICVGDVAGRQHAQQHIGRFCSPITRTPDRRPGLPHASLSSPGSWLSSFLQAPKLDNAISPQVPFGKGPEFSFNRALNARQPVSLRAFGS